MPNLVGTLRQFDALEFLFAFVVKNAYFHLSCVGGKDGEVGSIAIPGRAPGIWQSLTDCDRRCFYHPVVQSFLKIVHRKLTDL
jgi:hypothetical protein